MQSGFSGHGEPALTMPSAAVVAAVGRAWNQAGSSLLHLAGSVSQRASGKPLVFMSSGRGVIGVLAAPTSSLPAPRVAGLAAVLGLVVEGASAARLPAICGALTSGAED